MFHVTETEFKSFAALIKQFKIEHHPIMIERAEARFYLYHPGHRVVMTAMVQAVIRYRQLHRTELSFTEWRDAYLLDKKHGTSNDDATSPVTVKYQTRRGYLKEQKETKEQLKGTITKYMREMMIKNKDNILYVQYQLNTIDSIIQHLIEDDYQLDDDVWSDHPEFEYLLIDMKEKRVTLVEEYWISMVQELELPIFTDDTYKDILLFHE
jgi:hypothetical protein